MLSIHKINFFDYVSIDYRLYINYNEYIIRKEYIA